MLRFAYFFGAYSLLQSSWNDCQRKQRRSKKSKKLKSRRWRTFIKNFLVAGLRMNWISDFCDVSFSGNTDKKPWYRSCLCGERHPQEEWRAELPPHGGTRRCCFCQSPDCPDHERCEFSSSVFSCRVYKVKCLNVNFFFIIAKWWHHLNEAQFLR